MCERCTGLSRRGLLAALSASLVAAAAPAPPDAITGEQALHRLMEGNARYRANRTHVRDFAVDRATRVITHRPIASVLSCSDARVGPEFVFDQGPGDLFVVRVAGNVLEDGGLASLE
jgi:carbonic anhydrase